MIFYTSITNGYDKLSDAPKGVRCICFWDGLKPTAENWEYERINKDYIKCPVRRSYYPKHLPHHYFKNECTVWVDASYKIEESLISYSKKIFEDHDLVMQKHPDQRSIVTEFSKLYSQGWSSEEEIMNMAKSIKKINFNLKNYIQTINSVIWRRLTPEVNEWSELWHKWYMNGVTRDQVSSSVAEFVMSKKYRAPLHFNITKVSPKIDMKRSTRVKNYCEAYDMKPIPTKNDQIKIVDSLKNLFDDGANKMYACVKYMPFELNDKVKNLTVYTCITNGYDEFPKDNYYDPDVRYVCFHDGTVDTSIEPWEYIKLNVDIKCPRRLSFYPKANPHLWFPNGTHTVWIDGCYKHTKEFIEKAKSCFPFTMLRHASKFSYFDEMLEGFTCAFFNYKDAILLTKKLKEINYNFRTYGSPLGTIVYRTMSDEMTKFNKLWYEWSLVGCNRDQISFDVALKKSGIQLPSVFEDRNDTGVPLGFYNKKGRKGMHPQNGDKEQYLNSDKLLSELSEITGLNPKLYTSYPFHSFYMKVYNII